MKAALAVTVLIVGLGCGAGEAPEEGRSSWGDARVGGDVISVVEGEPITRADVAHARRLAAEPAPHELLARLEDEALLAHAAERAGYGDDPAVRRATRQAMVQLLLAREVEARVGREAIDRAALEAELAANEARFDRPERRRSVHVLARVPDGASEADAEAARAFIHAEHARVAAAPEPASAIRAIRRRPPEARPFEVLVEDVAAVASDEPLDEAYLRALFALREPGLVPAPIETAHGWHVVALTEIEPAVRATREEALATLEDEHLSRRRAARLAELVAELARARGVALDPRAHAALGAVSLAEGER